MITASHLTRRFGAFTAVDDVSFHLEAGEVVGFLGPNGAGKTTTLRMLTGFLPATSGKVEIAGLNVLRDSLKVRRHIGYLPESVPLYREHRVQEMLAFQARLHRVPRRDAKRRIAEVLERVDMTAKARALVGKLSKGQRQRVGLAVALLPSPDVLILDEPTSGLDPLQRMQVRKLIGELAQEHTVLLSSHILPEIEAVCPRVLVVKAGRIVADGSPAQLVAELGHPSHVRLEAMVPDPAEAARLLRSLDGVHAVEDRGRLGIHHQFDVHADTDLREDVGAVAASRGWALRELSWRQPTLEELFARLALDLDAPAPEAADASGAPSGDAPALADASPAQAALQVGGPAHLTPLDVSGPAANPSNRPAPSAPAPTETAPRRVYNLNPFDQGASRDLGAPKTVDAPETADDGPKPADGPSGSGGGASGS